MYSRKTTTLLAEATKAIVGLRTVCVIKYAGDARYGRSNLVASHDHLFMKAICVSSLEVDPPEMPTNVDFIAIDEAQFIAGVSDFCKRQNLLGRDVVVAALNSKADQVRSVWANVVGFLSFATVVSLRATCIICQEEAECSRYIEGTLKSASGIEIGGDSKYVSTCGRCYEVPLTEEILGKRKEAIRLAKWLSSPELE